MDDIFVQFIGLGLGLSKKLSGHGLMMMAGLPDPFLRIRARNKSADSQ